MSNVDDKFTYTWANVSKDIVNTDPQTGWGVDTSTTYQVSIPENVANDINKSFQGLLDSTVSLGKNTLRVAFGGLSTSAAVLDPTALGKDISSITATTSGATVDYLQEKWRNFLEKYIFSTTAVSVKSMLEDVGALTISTSNNDNLKKSYGYNSTETIFDKLVNKLDDLTAQFLGIEPGEDWGDLAENLFTDYTSSISNNDQFLETISNMQVVKGYMETLQGVMDGVQDIIDILKKLEPAMPLIEIAVAWAGVLFNPTSASDAVNKTNALAQELLDKALQISITMLKKYVFSIKIDLPTILVSSANTIGLNDNFGFGSLETMIDTYISYNESGSVGGSSSKLSKINSILKDNSSIDLRDKNVQEAIKWLENSKLSARQWQSFDFNGGATGNGVWKKNNYLSQGVDNIMTSIANRAASIAGSQNIDFIYDDETGELKMSVNGNLVSLNDYYFPRNSVGNTESSSKDSLQSILTDEDIINISGKILSNT